MRGMLSKPSSADGSFSNLSDRLLPSFTMTAVLPENARRDLDGGDRQLKSVLCNQMSVLVTKTPDKTPKKTRGRTFMSVHWLCIKKRRNRRPSYVQRKEETPTNTSKAISYVSYQTIFWMGDITPWSLRWLLSNCFWPRHRPAHTPLKPRVVCVLSTTMKNVN